MGTQWRILPSWESSVVRKLKTKKAHKQIQKDIKQKIGLFDRMPDECLACEKPFDKKDRDQVMSWNVVVKRDPDVVRLYCPNCWETAQSVVKDFDTRVRERSEES